MRQAQGVKTSHLNAEEPDKILAAAALLKQGHLVAFPTDTLYGVGADAFNQEAIELLYQVKQRPLQKGIPILLADLSDLGNVAREIPASAVTYIDRFWPGPLTLIVPRHPDLPDIISPNDGIAVRIPDSDVARTLIRAAGGALATSSANRTGFSPASTGAEAFANLSGLVTAVLDDGPCPQGEASTIVDCRGNIPQIIRLGPIPASALSLASA